MTWGVREISGSTLFKDVATKYEHRFSAHNGVPGGARGRASRGVPATKRKKNVGRLVHTAAKAARDGGAKRYDKGKMHDARDRVRKGELPAAVEATAAVADAGADVDAQVLMKPLAMTRMRGRWARPWAEVESEVGASGGAVGAPGAVVQCNGVDEMMIFGVRLQLRRQRQQRPRFPVGGVRSEACARCEDGLC
jgi:hypothetical protein